MTRRLTANTIALAFACTSLTPVALGAQATRAVHFGVMGGVTAPVGLLSEASTAGWNLGALVSFDMPESPLSVRIEGQWHQLGGSGGVNGCLLAPNLLAHVSHSFIPGGNGYCPEPIDFRVIDASGDLIYTFSSDRPTKFYLIAGAGAYSERATAPANATQGSATKVGVNAGAGVKFGLSSTLGGFVEARYHILFHASNVGDYAERSSDVKSMQFVPISAGVTF